MSQINAPRGTRDILPTDFGLWHAAQTEGQQVAEQMGFRQIRTPLYEEIALFERSIGEGTDVMDKELFLVRGKHGEDEHLALRPEGTAGIVRAYIEHGMHTWPQPVRLYSLVNCFRYERPQRGRYREHWQLDMEYLGDKGPFADAWIILTTWLFLKRCGLENLSLKLNSLGTAEERGRYIENLKSELEPLRERLSEDSQRRLSSNPLRILDSKDEGDRALLSHLPVLADFFSEESQAHFAAVRQYLDEWQIPYVLDAHLVRGLDYYAHTTFEVISTQRSGAQNSLGGGGRYDGLLTQLGGPDNGGVGVGIGLDRVVEEMAEQGKTGTAPLVPVVFLAAADEQGRGMVRRLLVELAMAGLPVDAALGKDSLSAQLKVAGRSGARYAAIVGQGEAERGEVQLKNLETGEQNTVPAVSLLEQLRHS